jgi:8-oxo-dGTP pyrophosphatase MutT (NUDIX family)
VTSSNIPLKVRRNARVVLLNARQELLLMKIVLPDRSFWCTIGGGIEESESPELAARRELTEETGLDPDEVLWKGPIWHGEHVVPRDGIPMLNKEVFILGHTAREDVWPQALTEEEVPVVKELRWWSHADMCSTPEWIVPPGLPAHIRPILEGWVPEQPLLIDLSGAPPGQS